MRKHTTPQFNVQGCAAGVKCAPLRGLKSSAGGGLSNKKDAVTKPVTAAVVSSSVYTLSTMWLRCSLLTTSMTTPPSAPVTAMQSPISLDGM